jgi:DNA polymerase (family X)
MPNDAFSQILDDMAFLAELRDENPFKIRAWKNAAGIFAELSEPVEALVANGGIKGIEGVGKGTQALAKEYVETGKVAELEEMKKAFPPGILELRGVRGLGPKKIRQLYEDLNISSLAELEYACEENRLVDLKGFGEKTQANILKSIQEARSYKGKVILPVALQEAEEIREELASLKGIKRVEPTGELRRHSEILGSIDFLVEGDSAVLEKDGFTKEDGFWRKNSERGMEVRAFLATAKDFGSRWVETTGPGEFVEKLGKISPASTEEEVFSAKKAKFMPAECRDLGLPSDQLIEEKDIRGVFHLHTTWSDGKNTLEEMVIEAEKLGLEYLGVSEHSQSAFYANGLDEKRVAEQRAEIAKIQKKHPKVRIFHGIESDILADGSLDYPTSVLQQFDFVIASVHGQMKMNKDDMTKRLCGALANPATTWLGHWTGRLLLGRSGYEFDVEKVLQCAARHGKAIELNANPYRLDIDWRVLPRAVELGVGIGIFPDAHSTGGLQDTKFGVWMARKAGLSPAQVLNTKSRAEMEQWLRDRK